MLLELPVILGRCVAECDYSGFEAQFDQSLNRGIRNYTKRMILQLSVFMLQSSSELMT